MLPPFNIDDFFDIALPAIIYLMVFLVGTTGNAMVVIFGTEMVTIDPFVGYIRGKSIQKDENRDEYLPGITFYGGFMPPDILCTNYGKDTSWHKTSIEESFSVRQVHVPFVVAGKVRLLWCALYSAVFLLLLGANNDHDFV